MNSFDLLVKVLYIEFVRTEMAHIVCQDLNRALDELSTEEVEIDRCPADIARDVEAHLPVRLVRVGVYRVGTWA